MTLTVNIRLERHVPASLMALRVGNKFETVTGDIDEFKEVTSQIAVQSKRMGCSAL